MPLDILAPEVSARIGGHVAVKREISRLGTDQDFIPLQFPGINQLPECCADIALRALVSVVNSCIQNIDAGVQGGKDGFRIGRVGDIVRFAKISSQANRG